MSLWATRRRTGKEQDHEKREMRQHRTELAQSKERGAEPFLELALHKEGP